MVNSKYDVKSYLTQPVNLKFSYLINSITESHTEKDNMIYGLLYYKPRHTIIDRLDAAALLDNISVNLVK